MVVRAGEGRSLASFGRPRDILRCNVRLLVMPPSPIASVGTDQCAIFRIVATVIYYFSLFVTACHRLFTYHCLAPVLAGKNEHRLVLFAGKSEHHLDLVNTCFTPTNFMFTGHRSKYIRERAHAASVSVSVSVTYVRTHVCTHTRTQPIVSILDKCRALWGEPERIKCEQLQSAAEHSRCGLWWCEQY